MKYLQCILLLSALFLNSPAIADSTMTDTTNVSAIEATANPNVGNILLMQSNQQENKPNFSDPINYQDSIIVNDICGKDCIDWP